MPGIKRRVAPLLALALTGPLLFACLSSPALGSPAFATPQAYSLAQATLDQGRIELDEMSQRETVVSQEMAKAAATQKAILEQTQSASNAEAIALDQAATQQLLSAAATLNASNISVTETAQAQAVLNAQAAQTAQANATQTAFSLTATPWAALQIDLARDKTEAERAARWQEYVFTPLKQVGLYLVAPLLLIFTVVLAYRWLMSVIDPLYQPVTLRPLGTLRPLRKRRSMNNATSQVEIVGSSEPSVVNWIAEAEKQLRRRP